MPLTIIRNYFQFFLAPYRYCPYLCVMEQVARKYEVIDRETGKPVELGYRSRKQWRVYPSAAIQEHNASGRTPKVSKDTHYVRVVTYGYIREHNLEIR